MTRDELMKKAAECDLGRVVGPLETLLDEEWESLHRFVDYCLRAEAEALRKERDTAVGATALRCIEMAKWPQGIDDEQAFYGRMFAEFIEREFRAAIDAAKGGAMPRERCPHEHAVEDWRLNVAPREGGGNG